MKRVTWAAAAALVASSTCATAADTAGADTFVAMERAALDRWGRGDPRGYLEIMAPEVSYFDPGQGARVDGLQSMNDLLVPWTGKIKIDRYVMLSPKVQRHGDVAVLSFNLVNYRSQPDGSERPVVRWNATEVYGRVGGQWRIIHSHWSFVKPDLKQPIAEGF